MSEQTDWTVGPDGRANSSETFERLVLEVLRLLRNHRIGDDPVGTARLIMAQLAHVHGLKPANGREEL